MIVAERMLNGIRRQYVGKRIVLAGGAFDILHSGHLDYLEKCKGLGDLLVIALASDADIKIRKGSGRPIISEDRRARMVDALKPVDYVTIRRGYNFADSHIRIGHALQPDVIVFYADMPKAELKVITESLPKVLIVIDRQPKQDSTTSILGRLKHLPPHDIA